MTLCESLRPKRLSDLWGQGELVAQIRSQMQTRPPSSWMFAGPSGVGKTSISRIIAVAYNCTHQKPGAWGDPCDKCIASTNFPIHEINVGSERGVSELGEVAAMSVYQPVTGNHRVIILDEFQSATAQAQKLLLKPFEEPSAKTIWIVCTTDPPKISPMLRRRLTTYTLKPLGYEEREKFLTNAAEINSIEQDLSPLFEQVHQAGIGSPAILLQALEKFAAGSSAEEAVANSEVISANTLAICKACTNGSWRTLRDLLAQVAPEESRWVRASVAGWLKAIMIRENDPKRAANAAASLHELTAMAPLEDAQLLLWLWPVLWKICSRYGTRS